jgi:hypothetical protein
MSEWRVCVPRTLCSVHIRIHAGTCGRLLPSLNFNSAIDIVGKWRRAFACGVPCTFDVDD